MYKIISIPLVRFEGDQSPLNESALKLVLEKRANKREVKIKIAIASVPDVIDKAPFVIPDFSKQFPSIYTSCSYSPVFGKKGNYIDDLISLFASKSRSKEQNALEIVDKIKKNLAKSKMITAVTDLFMNNIYSLCETNGVTV